MHAWAHWLDLACVLLLLCQLPLWCLADATAALSNSSVAAVSDVALQVELEIPGDAVLLFSFDQELVTATSSAIDTPIRLQDESIVDGTWTLTARTAHTLELTRSGGSYLPPDTPVAIVIRDIANPAHAGQVALGSLLVSNDTEPSICDLTLPNVFITPGALWTTQVTMSPMLSGRMSTLSLAIAPAHSIPVGGSIVVSLPSIYGILSAAALSGIDRLDGQMTLVTGVPNELRLQRVNSTGTASSASQTLQLNVLNLLQPALEGPIGQTIRIDTLDSDDLLIDQGYWNASALRLSRVEVLVSTRELLVDEGNASAYMMTLSAPPEGASVTITIASAVTTAASTATISVSPNRVVFTTANWSSSAVVQVACADDYVARQQSTVVLSHTIVETDEASAFGLVPSVAVRIQENDTPLMHISSRYASVIDGLRNDSYEIVLLSQPTASVQIDLQSSSWFVMPSPSSILFTTSAWNVSQAISVQSNESASSGSRSQWMQIVHHLSSDDPNYNGMDQSVVPQNHLTVYYEPLNTDACTTQCRLGWFPYVNTTTGSAQCVACPLGFYCVGGCEAPIACVKGTASSVAFASSNTSCTSCSSGSYAPQAGMLTCLICPAGAACADASALFAPCPIGTFASANQVACLDCPAGTYNNQTFQSSCAACPTGYYCPQGTFTPIACAAKTFSIQNGSVPCEVCPAGYACTSLLASPTPCPTGTYALQGNATCTICPRGYACASTSESPHQCELGLYSADGAVSCRSCPQGFSCPHTTVDPVPCSLGTYSNSLNASSCRSCPAGYGCPDPSISPALCPAGTYSSQGDYACHACPAGMYCSDPFQTPANCSTLTYSLGNSTSCTATTIGSVFVSTSVAPVACQPGYYSVNASTPCQLCSPGYFCASNAQLPVACPQGTYSLGGAVQCTTCPFGYTCEFPNAPQACPDGETNNANHSACIVCPQGYECTASSGIPTPCPLGSYSLEGDGQCTSCPKGYKCPLPAEFPIRCGNTTFAPLGAFECTPCLAGYYCPAPTLDPIPCPSWHFSNRSSLECTPCLAGYDCTSPSSIPVPCPAGTYSLTVGSACSACPAGAACASPASAPVACQSGTFSIGRQSVCTPCAAGHYCPYANQNIQIGCANGTYAITGATNCTSCPVGKQCPSTFQDTVQTCTPGTFSLGSQAACSPCPPGYKCPKVDGSQNAACTLGTYATGSAVECSTCPAGFACPDPKSDSLIECTAGYFSLAGATTCTACPPGYACPDTTTANTKISCAAGSYSTGGAAVCTPCPAGYACTFTNSSDFNPCPTGWYSPAGSASCVVCPRGYYCDTLGDMPKNCTVGSYSLQGSSNCTYCDPGYECPNSDQLPQPCPVGYYSEGAVANCRPCYPGYKCGLASTNPTPPEDACPMGGYCNPATTFFLCPAGTFGNVTAGESVDHACSACPEGYYCEMGSTPLTRQICPLGYYCPEGTKRASQYSCPAGTYNPVAGQFSIDDCIVCPSGSYCEEASSAPAACPLGYYCLEGTQSVNQYPCPAGTYSGPQTGLKIASQCQSCDLGNYCPEASSTATRCPAGTYNPSPHAAAIHECIACPSGWSCPHVGQTTYEDRCAPGHYCPSGTVLSTANPCPAGTYTYADDLIRVEDCTVCPLRHACPIGTGGDTQTMLDCGAGFFCPNGTAYSNQFPCLPGTWSASTELANADECEICPTGKYCSGGKSYIDGNCSAGYYCPFGTPASRTYPCPSGTYTAHTWLFEPSQCDDCPPGSYCPAGSVAPIPCTPGSYSSFNNTKTVGPASFWPSCVTCPAGYYCVEGSVTPVVCGKGAYSPSGAKACSTCQAGYFCNSDTTTDVNMTSTLVSWTPGSLFGQCYNGTYCPPGMDSEPALLPDACPPAYFCPRATPAPIVCPAGTYSNLTGQDSMDDCIPTPAGYYSLEGSLAATGICSPGYYCPIRSSSPTQVPCPARYYLNRTGGRMEDDCALCVAGSYCPKASAYPIVCPAGSYCRTGVSSPEPCPIGTYANATGLRQVEDCLSCSPGMYCDSTGLTTPRGLCDPGYYCTMGAYTSAPMNYESTLFGIANQHTGAQCPRGSYCPLGSAAPTLCPSGTFNNYTGLEAVNQCVQCTAGQYCETPGLSLPTGDCFSGYYCTGGASTPTQMPAPAGYFSGNGSASPSPCAAGYFNLYPKQDTCVECPSGFYCGSPGTIQPVVCPSGNYCPKTTALPIKCPPGTFANQTSLIELAQCQACPAGLFCDSYGLSAPSGKCLEGFVCVGGSPVANPNQASYGYVCPAGHYCPQGSGVEIQCPFGTYRATASGTNLTACSSCPGGLFCGDTALTAPSGNCSAGFYCVASAASSTPVDNQTGNICPAGYYCPGATVAPIKCAAGTFANTTGKTACDICPRGFYCNGIATNVYLDCPQGYFCPQGTGATPEPCPIGTFSNVTNLVNVTECLNCTAGFYCETEALTMPTSTCLNGYFCPPRSENRFGKTTTNAINACPAGSYCPNGTYVPIPCPRGSYSNATALGSVVQCVFCDEGRYCADPGLTQPSGLCNSGYVCKRNNTVATPSMGITVVNANISFGGVVCPEGSYCPIGSVGPLLCAEGSYANETGSALCTACPSGYFCPLGSTGYASNVCPLGYYCPAGTMRSTEFPCLPGSYGNQTGLQDVSQCTPAPGGMYVDQPASTQPSGVCKSGFYCSSGATSSTPALGATGGPCLPGTNCPQGSAVPIVCDAGYYCASTNTEQALPCDGGFYCIQGSYTATPTGTNNSLGMIGDVCTVGHYCPAGSSNPTPCPPGTFSRNTQNVQASDCFLCPAGFLCSESGIAIPYEKCPAGYICTGGEREATQLCPKGYECPEGSSQPTLCVAGSFSDEEGLAQCKLCPERYYCDAGCITPVACTLGYYCPIQTPSATSYPCLAGTFGNQTTLAGPDECSPCPPGKFCNGQYPTNTPTGECGPGYYCIGSAKTATPLDNITGGLCAGGFMCFHGAWLSTPIDNQTGRVCDPGHYCPTGSSVQVRCSKGTYNSFEQQTHCIECPAGYYCDTNATAPAICPLRYYCPNGTVDPVFCPNGTYGHQVGLEDASQCAACSAGRYCVDGTLTADCAAGFYCSLYNREPNPSNRTADIGGPCPIGHYCPQGVLEPLPCPNSTARLETMGASVDDCGPCPAGMSCEYGPETVVCPAGSYCSYAMSVIECPAGTFNNHTGMQNLEDCLPCDAGKVCNRTGIRDLTDYDCPAGHYCLQGSASPTQCPAGRYRSVRGGTNVTDCSLCTGGSYCEVGSVNPVVCDSMTYCPIGSGQPVVCPGGSYCPYNTTAPILCPQGFYCPMGVDLPMECTIGHYCPAGTESQLPCPLGYIGRDPPLYGAYTTLNNACETCPEGTYGIDPNRTQCDTCLEGYICLEATKSSHPVSIESDNGYPCPPGFYCPAGSFQELACPNGTYQPDYRAVNESYCHLCPTNSYQNLAGQASCLPCSTSAYSAEGATQCTCTGGHRAFQMTDGFCICAPGYVFYDQDLILRSDEDGDVDCQPIVYNRCGTGQVRTEEGSCVSSSKTSCDSSCNNGTGTYISSVGLCQCTAQADVDTVCDKTCRANAEQIQVNSSTGELQLYNPVTGEVTTLSNGSSSSVVSQTSCSTGACQLQSLTLESTGVEGTYGVPSSLSSSSSSGRRRLTTSSSSISNPMVCLNVGDGILFDLSTPLSYPIYLKDSMLNTNANFDYGAFRALATKIKANSSSVTAFAFSFTEAGTYVFGNSLNSATRTVITVMQSGTSCPTEAAIVPLSEANLISVSAKRRTDDVILAPDWTLILGLLGGLFGMVTAIILGLYMFRTKSWTNSTFSKKLAGYRSKSKQTDLATMHSKGSIAVNKVAASSVQGGDTVNSLMVLGVNIEGASSPNDLHSHDGEYHPDLGRWDDEDLDVRELVDRLQYHHDSVTKCFKDQKGDVDKMLQHFQAEAAELKRIFASALASTTTKAGGPTGMNLPKIPKGDDGSRLGPCFDISPQQSKQSGKEGFFLENLERDLMDRRKFKKRKSDALVEANRLLHDIEDWNRHLPQFAAAMVAEMVTSANDSQQQQQPEATVMPRLHIDQVQGTLCDLISLLCSDPAAMTTLSIARLSEAEKVRRDIGDIVLEASQRPLCGILANTSPESVDENGIKTLFELQEQVAKAQNKEDEVFNGQLAVLEKFGAAIPKILNVMDNLEADFQQELGKIREEQNPAKEQALKNQMQEKLTKIMNELAKAAGKTNAGLHKESGKVSKTEQVAHAAEKTLETALIEVNDKVVVAQKLREKETEKAEEELRQAEAVIEQEKATAKSDEDKLRDETLFQIKDLLVSLSTQLPMEPHVGLAPSELFLRSAVVPQVGTSPLDLSSQNQQQREMRALLQRAQSTLDLDALRKAAESEAQDAIENHDVMQQEYAEMLDESLPELSPEEKEHLLQDFASDLRQMESSVNVEAKKSEEELTNLLSARAAIREKQQEAMDDHEKARDQAMKEQQHEQVQDLESQFLEQEKAIEQEYLQELSKLEEEFADLNPDANETLGNNDDDMFGEEAGDEAERPEYLGDAEEMERALSLDIDDTEDDADIIDSLNSTYGQAWQDNLAALRLEVKIRKNQLGERLERTRQDLMTRRSHGSGTPADANAIDAAIEKEKQQELARIGRKIVGMRDFQLEALASKQDELNAKSSQSAQASVDHLQMLLDDIKRRHAEAEKKLRAQLAEERKRREQQLRDRLEKRKLSKAGALKEPDSTVADTDLIKPLEAELEAGEFAALAELEQNQSDEIKKVLSTAEVNALNQYEEANNTQKESDNQIEQLKLNDDHAEEELNEALQVELASAKQNLNDRLTEMRAQAEQEGLDISTMASNELAERDAHEKHIAGFTSDWINREQQKRNALREKFEDAGKKAAIQKAIADAQLKFIRGLNLDDKVSASPKAVSRDQASHKSGAMSSRKQGQQITSRHSNNALGRILSHIEKEAAEELERLTKEYEAAYRAQKQQLDLEQAARRAKLLERMKRRRMALRNKADGSPSEISSDQIVAEEALIDEEEQHELEEIDATAISKADELERDYTTQQARLADELQTVIGETTKEIKDLMEKCIKEHETELGNLRASQQLDREHQLQLLDERLQEKRAKKLANLTAAGASSDEMSKAENELIIEDQKELDQLKAALDDMDLQATKALVLQQDKNLDDARQEFHKKSSQKCEQTLASKQNIEDELVRLKTENRRGIETLKATLDAEKYRQMERLQQRIAQKQAQRNENEPGDSDSPAEKEERELQQLEDQLAKQSQSAIDDEKTRQQEEEKIVSLRLEQACIAAAAAQITQKTCEAVTSIDPGRVIEEYESGRKSHQEEQQSEFLAQKKRLAARIAASKKKAMLHTFPTTTDGWTSSSVSLEPSASIVLDAMAIGMEEQIKRLSNAHMKAWEERQAHLGNEEAVRKARLAERIQRKRAELMRKSDMTPLQQQALEAEEQVELKAIMDEMDEKQSQLDAEISQELEVIADTVQQAVSASAQDFERQLGACRSNYERDLGELQASLDLDRKRQLDALKGRIAQRRRQKENEITDGSTKADIMELESGLQSQEDEQMRALSAELSAQETNAIQRLEDAYSLDANNIAERVAQDATDRYNQAKQEQENADAALSKLLLEREDALKSLEAALASERKRQERKLSERMEKRRQEKIQALEAGAANMNPEELETAHQELEEQEQADKRRFDETLSAQVTKAMQEEEDRFSDPAEKLKAEARRRALELEAAEAARIALEAARKAELDRIAQEFERYKQSNNDDDEAEAERLKRKLQDRLNARLRKEPLVEKAETRNASNSPGHDSQPAPDDLPLEPTTVLSDTMQNALDDQIMKLSDAHLKAWEERKARVENEAALRKAQLAERMRRKRANTNANSPEQQAIDAEEQVEKQAIATQLAQKRAKLDDEINNELEMIASTVQKAKSLTTQALENELAACRSSYEHDVDELRKSLDLDRQRQQQALQDRILQRRRQHESSLPPDSSPENAAGAQSQLNEEEEKFVNALNDKLAQDEAENLRRLENEHAQNVSAIAEKVAQDAAERVDQARLQQEEAESMLNKLKGEHEDGIKHLQEALAAERKRQEDRLAERMTKRRQDKTKELAAKSADISPQDLAAAQHALDEQEEADKSRLDAALRSQAEHAIKEEKERFEAKQAQHAADARHRALELEAAEAAHNAAEAARLVELARIAAEYEKNKRSAQYDEAADGERQKQKLQDRLRARKKKKAEASTRNLNATTEDDAPNTSNDAAHENLRLIAEKKAQEELDRLQLEHERARKERCDQLEQEAALRKAQLAERMKKKRAEMRSGEVGASPEEQHLMEEALVKEETQVLEAIDSNLERDKQDLIDQVARDAEAAKLAVQEAAHRSAQEIEEMLMNCKRNHEEEEKKLKLALEVERERQEKTLQDRIAKRKEKKARAALEKQELERRSSMPAEEEESAPAALDEEEELEKKALQDELEAQEASAWEEIRRKQEEEREQLARASEEIALKKQKEAKKQQEHAQQELERLRKEHEDEMRTLTESLLADQKRQEQKLQQRITQRREKKKKEAEDTLQSDQDRQRELQEEEDEQKALEEKLQQEILHKIEEEKARQRQEELEAASKLAQASIDAAAAEAAKRALEAARTLEIERLAQEYADTSKELHKSRESELLAQKKKLEARMAAKKQKKLMELEAKKEMELQKLKQKQAEENAAIADAQAQMENAIEAVAVAAMTDGDASGPPDLTNEESGESKPSEGADANEERKKLLIQQLKDKMELKKKQRAQEKESTAAAVASQQERDIAAVQLLFNHEVIPRRMPLIAGIELVVSHRHQDEQALLLAVQFKEKSAAIREGLRELMQQKAAAKALSVRTPVEDGSASSEPRDHEQRLRAIDKLYDEQLREREQQVIIEIEQQQTMQSSKLREAQLAQISFLMNYFSAQNAVAVAKSVEDEEAQARSNATLSQRHVVVYSTPPQNDQDDLINELRARLQVESNERMQQLTEDKQQEFRCLDQELESELAAVEKRFQQLAQEEQQAMEQSFQDRIKQSNPRQRIILQRELDNQVKKMLLMLDGRKGKRMARERHLMDKKRSMLEDEYARKAQAVTAKMMQRVIEEKELLRRKQELAQHENTGGSSKSKDGAAAKLPGESPDAALIEQRLATIEQLLRDKLFTKEAAQSEMVEAISTATSEQASASDKPVAEDAVEAYRQSIAEAVTRACQLERNRMADPQELDTITAHPVPREQLSANMQSRLDFTSFVMQLMEPPVENSKSSPPTSVRAAKLSAASPDAKYFFDSEARVLYLQPECLQELSTGQLAVLALHAQAQATTACSDVSDPAFIACMYSLLQRCYQSLFQHLQKHNQSPQAISLSQQSADPVTSTPLAPVAANAADPPLVHNHLHEMERLLSAFDTPPPLSGSKSSDLTLSIAQTLRASSSRFLLAPSSPRYPSKKDVMFSASSALLPPLTDEQLPAQEQLDEAEKLYSQALRQYQEQKESLEYLQEMLAEQEEELREDDDGQDQATAEQRQQRQKQVRDTQVEVGALRLALEQTKHDRDALFAQCQALRSVVPATPRTGASSSMTQQ